MIVSLRLCLWEFGREFHTAVPLHDTTAQTLAQNYIIYSRWQQPYQGSRVRPNFSMVRQKKSEVAPVRPAIQEKK